MDYFLLWINHVRDEFQGIYLGTGPQTINWHPAEIQIYSFVVKLIKTVEYTIHRYAFFCQLKRYQVWTL